MRLSRLIAALQECMKSDGDCNVCGIHNGEIFNEIEIHVDECGITWIELYKKG